MCDDGVNSTDVFQPIRFEDIPKRVEKMVRGRDRGFWFNVRNLTNSLGDSAFANIIIAILAPIVTRLLSAVVLLFYMNVSNTLSLEWFFNFIAFGMLVVLIQELFAWGIYGYLLYISYYQIRYNINRITGIVTPIIILATLPAIMFMIKLLTLNVQ